MAQIKRNPVTKKWDVEIRWRDGSGKQPSMSKSGFDRKPEAEEWAAEQQAIIDAGRGGSRKVTMNTLFDEWLRVFARKVKAGKRAETTLASYEYDAKKLKPLIGKMKVQELRSIHIEDALAELEGMPRTIDRAYRSLHAALSYAVKINIIRDNPAKQIERPKVEPIEYRILTAAEGKELMRLLGEQEHVLYVPATLALCVGLRRGEAFGLKWQNIDFTRSEIKICTSKTYAKKIIERDNVKTSASRSLLPMPPIVKEILEGEKRRQLEAGVISEYVCNVSNNTIERAARVLNNFQQVNGLPECRFHDLRHSMASILFAEDVPVEVISALLRHANVKITHDTYIHIFDDTKRAASDKIQKIFEIR